MMIPKSTDVLILGGGPTGSTAGMVLARLGIKPLIIESDRHPRFHVGESLLPHTLPIFDRLGVHDAIRALPRTLIKPGATFISFDGEERSDFWFDESMEPVIPYAYNVRRDEFDEALLRVAQREGATVCEGWKALAPEWEGDRLAAIRVRAADGAEGSIRAKCVIDATGQHAFPCAPDASLLAYGSLPDCGYSVLRRGRPVPTRASASARHPALRCRKR